MCILWAPRKQWLLLSIQLLGMIKHSLARMLKVNLVFTALKFPLCPNHKMMPTTYGTSQNPKSHCEAGKGLMVESW